MNRRIIQIVRRFGPVGGMEEYAWQLTCALAKTGHPVEVLCEVDDSNGDLDVPVTALGTSPRRHRWRKHLHFSSKVEKWVARQRANSCFLHSHEMVTHADLCTFHSTPHGMGENSAWWKRLDPTWHANQWLERRVLSTARCVIPVSQLLHQQLTDRHPFLKGTLASPVPPGIESAPPVDRTLEPVLGFMGWEWERKGLPLALKIHRNLPHTQLLIAGPSQKHLNGLLHETDRVEVMGRVDRDTFFSRIRLLIHPARLEAYGMVIPEALTRGLPVLTSTATGAAEAIPRDHGQALPLDASLATWITAAEQLLNVEPSQPLFHRNWDEVARETVAIYQSMP
ncbi:MAG: hypothetical protein CMJ68_13140 [Planctomycetaceae bacterium]|nr:hypothetical protein [Planctomycetaceae bacterium]|tara:strand:- start:3398 stop:4414 length:1017 start_codon:yes stop_codon:yes gene_type:complete